QARAGVHEALCEGLPAPPQAEREQRRRPHRRDHDDLEDEPLPVDLVRDAVHRNEKCLWPKKLVTIGTPTPITCAAVSTCSCIPSAGSAQRARTSVTTNVCSNASRFTATQRDACCLTGVAEGGKTCERINENPTASPTKKASTTATSSGTKKLKTMREPTFAAAARPPATRKIANWRVTPRPRARRARAPRAGSRRSCGPPGS